MPQYSKQIIHRHLKAKYEKHREKLEAHKNKGPAFREAVEKLEQLIFIKEVSCPESLSIPSVATPSMTSNAKE